MWPAVPESTRRVYEKKLQRLQEEGISPVTPELPAIVMETEVNHNGHADLDQFSDKEDGESIIITTTLRLGHLDRCYPKRLTISTFVGRKGNDNICLSVRMLIEPSAKH